MLKPVLHNPWVQAILVVLGIALFLFLCYVLKPVLVPLLIAFLVAYTFDPLVDIFEARKIPRMVAIVGLVLIFIIILACIPLFLVPQIISQADQLVTAAQQAGTTDGALAGVADWVFDRLPVEKLAVLFGWQEGSLEGGRPRAFLAQKIADFVRDNTSQLGNAGQALAKSAGRTVLNLVFFIAKFALFFVVTAYLLNSFDRVVAEARKLIPPRNRESAIGIISKMDHQLRSFLVGQSLVCLCLGAIYSIGLVISGVPFAVLLGLIGGAISIVPFLGITLTVGPAVLLTVIQHGFDWHVIGTILTFVIGQFLESNILTPKIVGGRVGLNPVWVILSILVFGNAFGFVGLLLAAPAAAVLKVLVLEGVDRYRRSPFFEGDAAP